MAKYRIVKRTQYNDDGVEINSAYFVQRRFLWFFWWIESYPALWCRYSSKINDLRSRYCIFNTYAEACWIVKDILTAEDSKIKYRGTTIIKCVDESEGVKKVIYIDVKSIKKKDVGDNWSQILVPTRFSSDLVFLKQMIRENQQKEVVKTNKKIIRYF